MERKMNFLKITIFSILIILISYFIVAQEAPNEIRYNGTLADTNGNLVEGTKTLRFRLYDSLSGGSQLWSDTYSNVNIKSGAFTVRLGSITALPTGLPGTIYLQVEVQQGDDWEVMLPRMKITGAVSSISNSSSTGAQSCPNDMVWTGSFCVDLNRNTSRVTLMDALDGCAAEGKRVCKPWELNIVCDKKTELGITDIVAYANYLDYEFGIDKGDRGKTMMPNYVEYTWYLNGTDCRNTLEARVGKTDVRNDDTTVWCDENTFKIPADVCIVKAYFRCCK